jgi:hypothetical protein
MLALVIYYLFLGGFYAAMPGIFSGYTYVGNLSTVSTYSINSTFPANAVETYNSMTGFFGFAAFGIGLPASTPSWFQFIFSLWSIFLSVVTLIMIVAIIIEVVALIAGFFP